MEEVEKLPVKQRRPPFEGVDRREAGRRGGIASGQARRARNSLDPDAIARRILQTGHATAMASVLRGIRDQEHERRLGARQSLEELEAEISAAAGRLLDLREKEQALEASIDDLRRERDDVCDSLDALDARVAQRDEELRRAQTDDGLRDVLAAAGEERVEAVLGELGWLEDDDAAA